jgi:16S rRNA C1402 (ribose-2'-O) methylase RsmI
LHLHRAQRLPYEILPAPNTLLNTLAASGFPADRFALEYFPLSSAFLLSRTSMKMTVGIVLKNKQLKGMLSDISKVYGSSQMVYV